MEGGRQKGGERQTHKGKEKRTETQRSREKKPDTVGERKKQKQGETQIERDGNTKRECGKGESEGRGTKGDRGGGYACLLTCEFNVLLPHFSQNEASPRRLRRFNRQICGGLEFTYIYIYQYVYIWMYVYIYVNIHTYVYVYRYTYMCTYV